MMWLKFLTPKSAIYASFIALAGLLAVQSYRLYHWQIDYAELETKLEITKGSLMGTISANESNIILIDRYKKANQALLAHNAQNTEQTKKAAKDHQARLNEIQKRYEQAKQTPIMGTCVNFIISDDLDRMLKQKAAESRY